MGVFSREDIISYIREFEPFDIDELIQMIQECSARFDTSFEELVYKEIKDRFGDLAAHDYAWKNKRAQEEEFPEIDFQDDGEYGLDDLDGLGDYEYQKNMSLEELDKGYGQEKLETGFMLYTSFPGSVAFFDWLEDKEKYAKKYEAGEIKKNDYHEYMYQNFK